MDGHAIIYNSGLVINDPSLLACLAIFYERVYLPYTNPAASLTQHVSMNFGTSGNTVREDVQTIKWENQWQALFSESVLQRLSPASEKEQLPYLPEELDDVLGGWMTMSNGLIEARLGHREYPVDMLDHLRRTDLKWPQAFITRKGYLSREILVGLEAVHTFSYLMPKVGPLPTDAILEVRLKVRDIREGFAMHLQKLSQMLDQMSKESPKEISAAARSLIETELIPDYKEFRRQLGSLQASRWTRVLDAAGKIIEIEAAPWTPKFYGLLMKALGLTFVTTAAEQRERLSNQYQAFQFMTVVEEAAKQYVNLPSSGGVSKSLPAPRAQKLLSGRK